MPAAILNFVCAQNETFSRTFSITALSDPSNPKSPQVPVDLTGRSFKGQIRTGVGGQLIASFTFAIQDQSQQSMVGDVTINLSAAITQAMPIGPDGADAVYQYDCFQTLPDTSSQRFLKGTFTLQAAITQ